jgi:excisionase family DNA binding protein
MDTPLTPEEVAERWKCEAQLVRRLLKNGNLEGFKVGSHWRILPSKLVSFEEAGGCLITDSEDLKGSSSASGKKAENAAAIALARESQRKQEQPSKPSFVGDKPRWQTPGP